MDEQIKKLRSELKNIRLTQRALKADFQKDIDALCRDFDIERKIPHKKIKLQKATHKGCKVSNKNMILYRNNFNQQIFILDTIAQIA